jgi:hypothetical protein
MGREFGIPWIWEIIENTIGRQFDIPWVGVSKYHGLEGSNKIP